MKGLEDLKYTREHEWIKVDEEGAMVGITDHAQDALGDVVYVELPEVGDVFQKDDVFGVVESVKTTADLYAPVSGTVTEVNEELADSPQLVNEDCYGAGWLIRLKLEEPEALKTLFSLNQYEKFLEEEGED
jgi:glycine cleavage system H protein